MGWSLAFMRRSNSSAIFASMASGQRRVSTTTGFSLTIFTLSMFAFVVGGKVNNRLTAFQAVLNHPDLHFTFPARYYSYAGRNKLDCVIFCYLRRGKKQ
jgi:hypothetical protein